MDQPVELPVAQEILAKLPIGVLVTDSHQQLCWHNDAMQALLTADLPASTGTEQLLNESILPFLSAQGTFPLINQCDEQQKWLHHSSFPLSNGHQAHLYMDVTEAKYFQQERDRLVDQLRTTASIEPLTGLLTEHALLQGLDPLVSLSRRYDKDLTLAVITIKNIDTLLLDDKPLGQDLILVAVSQLLKDQMRWADLIACTETNRFVLVLPETNKTAAEQLVNKLESKLTSLESDELSLPKLALNIHINVTEWIRTDNAQSLLQRALSQ